MNNQIKIVSFIAGLVALLFLNVGCAAYQHIDHTMIALDKDHKPIFDANGKPVVLETKSSTTFGGTGWTSTNDHSYPNAGNWSAEQPTPSRNTATTTVRRTYQVNPDGTRTLVSSVPVTQPQAVPQGNYSGPVAYQGPTQYDGRVMQWGQR